MITATSGSPEYPAVMIFVDFRKCSRRPAQDSVPRKTSDPRPPGSLADDQTLPELQHGTPPHRNLLRRYGRWPQLRLGLIDGRYHASRDAGSDAAADTNDGGSAYLSKRARELAWRSCMQRMRRTGRGASERNRYAVSTDTRAGSGTRRNGDRWLAASGEDDFIEHRSRA